MQPRRVTIAVNLLCFTATFAAPSKPDFSGRWRIDQSSSSQGAPTDLTENIDHRDPLLRIDSDWDKTKPTGVGNAAMLAPSLDLKTDGLEGTNPMPMGLSITTKSRWDGAKLITDWRVTGLKDTMSGTWTRYLTGANAMVVDSVVQAAGRRVTSRFVFAK